MARGLRGWLRRDDVPAGRHARPFPTPTVPGAAATLVAAAAQDPRVRPGVWLREMAPEPADPEPGPAPSHEAPSGAVGLVFADGAQVQLDDGDPRAASLRQVASALINPS